MTTQPPKDNDSIGEPPSPNEPKTPATIAVALEEQADAPPSVVASGRGFVAEKILELAFANDVKVREDSDLVQVLSAVDVDSPIPTDAFTAVAEVLAYLYKANGDAVPDSLGDWHD